MSKFTLTEAIISIQSGNPLNPSIKIEILICCTYSFSIEVVGRS